MQSPNEGANNGAAGNTDGGYDRYEETDESYEDNMGAPIGTNGSRHGSSIGMVNRSTRMVAQ